MPWQAGQSGNKKGRPKSASLEELRKVCRLEGRDAVRRLAEYARKDDKDDPRMAAVIVQACNSLLDRMGVVAFKSPDLPVEPEQKPEAPPRTKEELMEAATEGEA